MDRRVLGMGDLIEPPPPTELTQAPIRMEDDLDEAANSLRSGSSAKIDQLVHLLKLTPGNEKSLVFSQFTTFLIKYVCCLLIIVPLNADGLFER
jgi:SWI/SNF-related matrix-associated actin-dependent regulator of chromatin subfamily A3